MVYTFCERHMKYTLQYIFSSYLRYAPVPLAGDAIALARRTALTRRKNSRYAVDTPHTPNDLH